MNHKSNLLAIALIATAQIVSACAQAVTATGPLQVAPPVLRVRAEPMGDGEPLSPELSQRIRHLDHVQQYETIKNVFGFPDARSSDGAADYYKLNGGAVAVLLYQGGQTTFIGIKEPLLSD